MVLIFFFLTGFDVDFTGDNFADHTAPVATPNDPGVGGRVTTPTPTALMGASDPSLAPPAAKKPRLEAKTAVTTVHPVSELTQKYQGAMFEFTGRQM